MIYANLDNATINLRFGSRHNVIATECSYNLGEELFNLLSLDINEVYSLYIELVESFMDLRYGSKSEKLFKSKVTEICKELDKHSVYLRLHTDMLLDHMEELQSGYQHAFEQLLIRQFPKFNGLGYYLQPILEDKALKAYFDIDFFDTYNPDLSGLDYSGAYEESLITRNPNGRPKTKARFKKVIGLSILLVAMDIHRKQELFLGDIDAITGDDKKLARLSLSQKLYLLDERRKDHEELPIYQNAVLWKTSFSHYPDIPQDLYGEKNVRNFILKNNVEIKQVHELQSMDNLIMFELLSLLDNKDSLIKKCRFCGQFFVPQGRSDTIFCDRIAKGETKPCRVIGSLKLHKEVKDSNPIHSAHQKAYRRMNSKCRTGRITQTEFFAWSEEARAKRDLCLKGELDFKSFSAWLESDKAAKKKTK
jgi:hypothetical protein